MSNDQALGLALLLGYLAMMLWGALKSLYPDEPKLRPPKGGHREEGGELNYASNANY